MPESVDDLTKALLKALRDDRNVWAIVQAATTVATADPRRRPPPGADVNAWCALRGRLKRALGGSTARRLSTRSTTHGALLTVAQARALHDHVVESLSDWEPQDVAYQLLFAVDEVLGESLIQALNIGAETRLGPGDLVPIAVQRLDVLFGEGRHFTARPRSKGLGLESLEHIGVLPETPLGGPYQVVLDYRYPSLFSAFFKVPVLAVLQPNVGMLEQHFSLELDLKAKRFFDVRPKSSATQLRTIEDLLRRAEDAGATLALLPELSVDAAIHERISRWVAEPARSLRTVLAGSLHGRRGDARFNRATLFGAGARAGVHHHKFSPYHHRHGEEVLEEDLQPQETVFRVFFCGGGRSLSFAICKDVLGDSAKAILNALRLNSLLVAALSSDSSAFEMDGLGRVSSGQTFTFVANYPGCIDRGISAALATLPLKDERVVHFPVDALDGPSALVLDLRARPLEWQVR